MPSPKCHRKGGLEKNKKGRLSERASSFHVRGGGVVAEMLPRPRTVPDLLAAGRSSGGSATEENMGRPQKLTKLLLHVTVQRSPGAVHVLLPPEATVDDLIAAAIRQYVKEARRPVIPADGASGFDLHYSQFSLESLDREEKIMELGSRNFFLCPKEAAATTNTSGGACVMTSAKCSKEVVDEAMKKDLPWLKLLNFLL
ncbi:hypothetical protein ABFS82_14G235700 [Erythranthe guttata]|uniref:DUF7054 domain-containing protein n=2 Tax=Erythranthe guttata TaxID=4155 RepID=A0A022R8P0_ERYGU|nr:PREDICTED: uncharacterized protein At4g22758 [Erythranthe guttata]EYU36098.1 hypothetical protein MIMGU_mgv1a014176mg [Erythranthe guttata]|eukprot:XP_012838558.1 PREDICTED: uncharacterized protein At4g22758 [Erythranthe guttata]